MLLTPYPSRLHRIHWITIDQSQSPCIYDFNCAEQLLDNTLLYHSTVTLFAKLRGLSTSVPRAHAVWYASNCSGTTCSSGESSP